MKKYTSLFTLILVNVNLFAQVVINKEYEVEGSIQLAPEIAIPKTNPGYTLWLPVQEPANGLIVFTHARRDTTQSEFIIDYALGKGLAVLYATTENQVEFFFSDERLQQIESYIHEAVSAHGIPKEKMLYCGMSLEGTRALKLAMFGQTNQSKFGLKPKAIAICDSPLDMVRFHKQMVKAKELGFSDVAKNEATWVSSYLESNLGGVPGEAMYRYISYSPYCYIDDSQKNLEYFKSIAIRAYTEPDVQWWIENRRKDYYGMNAIDLAVFVNELKILGNQNSELITTTDKGYLPNGVRHPHSWNIVDEKEMVDWFISLIE